MPVTKKPAAADKKKIPAKQGTKRASITPAGAPKKRATKDNAVSEQCKTVADALAQAELPNNVIRMLSACTASCLGEVSDKRHAWQVEAVKWIGTALADIETSLTQRSAEAQSKLDGVIAEQTTKAEALTAAEAKLAELQEASETAQKKRTDAAEEQSALAKASSEAHTAVAAEELEIATLSSLSEELQTTLSEGGLFASSKTGEVSNKDASSFTAIMKKHSFEVGLLQNVPGVMVQPPASRTEFGLMVLGQAEAALEKRLGELAEKKSEATAKHTEKTAAASAALEALKTAESGAEAFVTVEAEALASLREGDKAAKAAKKEQKAFPATIKQLQAAVKVESAALVAFQEGPLGTFKQLQDRCTPEPEPVEAEVQPAEETAQADDAPKEHQQEE